jgi:hypothetical protein
MGGRLCLLEYDMGGTMIRPGFAIPLHLMNARSQFDAQIQIFFLFLRAALITPLQC